MGYYWRYEVIHLNNLNWRLISSMETSIIYLLVLFLLLSALFCFCLYFILFFVPLEYFYNYWLKSIDGKLNAQNTIAIAQTSWNQQHRVIGLASTSASKLLEELNCNRLSRQDVPSIILSLTLLPTDFLSASSSSLMLTSGSITVGFWSCDLIIYKNN